MSYISDAVHGVCTALDHCFSAYDECRRISSMVRYPIDGVSVIDFSITAQSLEIYGSLAIVTDIEDWDGVCFVSDFSAGSKRWLDSGPLAVSASDFAKELVRNCTESPDFTLIMPPDSSLQAGFRFDLETR